ncbi:iron ABC transporter substrate-binding protein, partial [Streptococcus agalactiae]|nr:iron ABC transporter substrate-binding protein [Streptococcus agalactiae]
LDVQNAFGQSTSNRPIRKDAQTSNGMKALKDIATLKEDYRYVTKHKGQIFKTYNRIRRNAD